MYRRQVRSRSCWHRNWGHPNRDVCGANFVARLKDGVSLPAPVNNAGQFAELSELFGPVDRIEFTFSSAMGVSGADCRIAQLSSTPLSSSARPGLLLLPDCGINAENVALPALPAAIPDWETTVREGLWVVRWLSRPRRSSIRTTSQCRARLGPVPSRPIFRTTSPNPSNPAPRSASLAQASLPV